MRIVGFLGLGMGLFVAACAGSTEPSSAAAMADVTSAKVLLDCNVFLSGGGPDQQVTVVKRGADLFLHELTNTGSWEERPLSAEEWASHDLKLRHDDLDGPDAVNRLYKEDGYWMNEAKSDGWHAMGDADCWTDTTKK